MFVDFFIKRPILATVCSLVIILAGAVAIPTLPIAQYPDAGAAAGHRHRDLHRRQRAGGRDRGHDAARAGDQRRRGHALHHLVEHQQRRRARSPSRSTSTRDSGPRRGRRAEPRHPGARPPARRGPRSSASRVSKSSTGFVLGGRRLRRERRLRLAVPQQLHRRLRQGRAQARARRRRRHRLRRAQATRCGCGSIRRSWRRAGSPPATWSARCASRTSRSRPARVGQRAGAAGQMYQISVRAEGRLAERARVRRHHRQGRRRRHAGPPQGRRPRRARRRDLRARSCASRASKRSASASSSCPRANALDVDRAASGPSSSGCRRHFPPGLEVPGRVRHHRGRARVDPRGAEDAGRGDRRSSSSSSSSSCRAGAARSSRRSRSRCR